MRHKPINVETLMKYMKKTHGKNVEEKIGRLLPDKFALIFDGWTKRDTHYLGIFATYTSKSEEGYDNILFAYGPLKKRPIGTLITTWNS